MEPSGRSLPDPPDAGQADPWYGAVFGGLGGSSQPEGEEPLLLRDTGIWNETGTGGNEKQGWMRSGRSTAGKNLIQKSHTVSCLNIRTMGLHTCSFYNDLNANAERVGFRRFGTMVKAYMKQHEERRSGLSSVVNNLTDFKDQPIELLTGDWIANDDGILRRNGEQGMDVACVHPILPVQRLVNIDDGTVRLRIMFRRDFRGWREVIANKSTLFSSREIKKLADKDISVSDKNAAFLVEYLQDLEDLNHNTIPEAQSVSHLGWTSNGLFSPYMENLEFDGLENFSESV